MRGQRPGAGAGVSTATSQHGRAVVLERCALMLIPLGSAAQPHKPLPHSANAGITPMQAPPLPPATRRTVPLLLQLPQPPHLQPRLQLQQLHPLPPPSQPAQSARPQKLHLQASHQLAPAPAQQLHQSLLLASLVLQAAAKVQAAAKGQAAARAPQQQQQQQQVQRSLVLLWWAAV